MDEIEIMDRIYEMITKGEKVIYDFQKKHNYQHLYESLLFDLSKLHEEYYEWN